MKKKLLLLLASLLTGIAYAAETPGKIDFKAIPSPVIFRGDATTAYRDPAAIYADGWLRLFFTMVKIEPDGKIYSYVAWSKSRDLVHWTEPKTMTPRDQRLNFGSPGNIIRFEGQWVICLQTYPRPNGEKFGNGDSRIWIRRSTDLENWSEPELLQVKGPDVPREKMGRIIDPYLLEDKDEPDKWWCFSKGTGPAWSRDLKVWTPGGRNPGGENPCLVRDGNEYVLIHSRNRPDGISVIRSTDMKEWRDEGVNTLGQKDWPWAQGRLTAGFVLDLRKEPNVGKALMFFHGSDYPESDKRGGFDNFASVAMAWSDDLQAWDWAGNNGKLTRAVPTTDLSKVPGTVVTYSPAISERFIGSPSLAVLPDGTYVASHDFFGRGSTQESVGQTTVYRSSDKGQTWSKAAELTNQFWSTLFVHRDALYLIGTRCEYGDVIIRKSADGGRTWTVPENEESGVLFKGRYHGAPTPVLAAKGRIWRGMEDCSGPGFRWGLGFKAAMLSVPEGANLLKAANWTASNPLPSDKAWFDGRFRGWLEGNAIVDRNGNIVDLMRGELYPETDKAAILEVSPDGKKISFDPQTGFVDFPGANWKFTVRFDPVSKKYWSLANILAPVYRTQENLKSLLTRDPGSIRNTMALVSSEDLRKWEIRSVVLYDANYRRHAFQYADWQFDGEDLIALVRTAYEDGGDGARRPHDANLLTFHRFKNFRTMGAAQSVVAPEKLGLDLAK